MHTQSQLYEYGNSPHDPYGPANDLDYPTSLHGIPFPPNLNTHFQNNHNFQDHSSVFDQHQSFGQSDVGQSHYLDLSPYDDFYNHRRDSLLPNTTTGLQLQTPGTIYTGMGGFSSNIQDIFYPGLQESVQESTMSPARHRAAIQSPARRHTRSNKQSRRGDSVLSSPVTAPVVTAQRSRLSSQKLQELPAFDDSDKLLLKISALGFRNRLFQSKGYKQYRDGLSTAQVIRWPEHVEVAFIEACVVYRPDARAKSGGQDGRNGRISSHIFSVTGEWRSKKMITSHLQVVKAYIDDKSSEHIIDSLALSCLTKATTLIPSSLAERSWHEILQELLWEAGYYSGEQERLRNSILNSPYHKASSHRGPQISGKLGVLVPKAYEMILTRNDSTLAPPLHHFAVSTKQPKHVYKGLKDWAQFARRYPELDALQQERSLNCDVALIQSAIGRPKDDWAKFGRSHLAVSGSLRCAIEYLSAGTELAITTTIYHARQPIMTFNSLATVQVAQDDTRSVEIPSWPHRNFPDFVSLNKAETGTGSKRGGKSSSHDDELSGPTSNYTMTQEIDTITNDQRTRVLVVHHRFDNWTPVEKGGKNVFKFEGETRWQQIHISDRLQDETDDSHLSFQEPEPVTQLDTSSWVNANGIPVGYDNQTPASASRTASLSWKTPSSASSDVKKELLFSTPTTSNSSGASGIDSWLDPQLLDHSIATLPETIHPFDLSTPIGGSGVMMDQQHHHQFEYPSQGLNSYEMYQFDQSGSYGGDFGQ